MDLFLLALVSLFSVINPLGTIPVYMSLTEGKTRQQMVSISLFTCINVLVILLISFFIGKYVLSFFSISLNSLRIAGGLIIASSGFALLTGSFTKHKGLRKSVNDDARTRSSITLTPLAIPMLAGPGTISLLISYNQLYTDYSDKLIIVGAIVTIVVVIFLFLNVSRGISRALGASGMNSLSRIIGFIVIAIGIEFIISSVMDMAQLFVR
ncbi:MAG: NAAT family transporter [Bacteroidales bacterium]|nr:NAAT family transporter [Bacteroidales bacterium]